MCKPHIGIFTKPIKTTHKLKILFLQLKKLLLKLKYKILIKNLTLPNKLKKKRYQIEEFRSNVLLNLKIIKNNGIKINSKETKIIFQLVKLNTKKVHKIIKISLKKGKYKNKPKKIKLKLK